MDGIDCDGLRSVATYVVLVLALVVTSFSEPTSNVRTSERATCSASRSTTSIFTSKRVDAPAPAARNHAKDRKLFGLPGDAFAFEEPERQRVAERLWQAVDGNGTARLPQQTARAPPHS